MSKGFKQEWRTVQLPKSIVDQVEKIVSRKDSQYTGISDYISEHLNHSLEVKA